MGSGIPPWRDLHEELCELSSEVVARIHDGLHEMIDSDLRRACIDLLWTRHALIGGSWEIVERDIGSLQCEVTTEENRPLGIETWRQGEYEFYQATPHIRLHQIVRFCSHGADERDPGHRIARKLEWAYRDIKGRLRWFREIECTCGGRSDRSGTEGLYLKRRRIAPLPEVWPTVRFAKRNGGRPLFVVCKFAKGVDDTFHAPDTTGTQCICGAYLGSSNIDDNTDQFLSVQ